MKIAQTHVGLVDARLGSDADEGSWPAGALSTGAAGIGLFCIILLAMLSGCRGPQSLLPNPDPALRKKPTEFAAAAAKCFPYPADAPRAAAKARASVDYGADQIQIANLSDADWENVDLWVNGRYVLTLPHVQKASVGVKTIDFEMLYDDRGHPFPSVNTDDASRIQRMEILRDGTLYEMRVQLAD